MNIAKTGNPDRVVTLTGTREGCGKLKEMITERLAAEDRNGAGLTLGANGYFGGAGAAGALRGAGSMGGGGGGGGQQQMLDHPIVLRIALPHDKCGALIGRGGMTIRTLQENTQCTIKVPSAADASNPDVRTVQVGAHSQEQAEAAQAQIFAIIQEATVTRAAQMANQTTDYYQLPDQCAGMVIGKGGVTIKALQQRSQCRVQIPNTVEPGSNPPTRQCSISGAPEGIAIAKAELQNIVAQHTMGYGTPQQDPYGNVQNPYGGGGGGGGEGQQQHPSQLQDR
jgi:far upstream element-binding protein